MIVWVQRAWLALDLAVLMWFFVRDPFHVGETKDVLTRRRAVRGGLLFGAPALVLLLNFAWLGPASPEAEPALVRYDPRSEHWKEHGPSFADMVRQPLDMLACRGLNWGCRYLRVDHRTLVDHVWDTKAMADLHSTDAEPAKALAGIEGVVLRGRSLRFAVLDASRLYAADLVGADLRGASLAETNLSGATMRTTNLQGADLNFANLQGADLRGAHLEHVDLSSAQLQGANLQAAQLQGADLNSANLQGADLRRALLQGANLSEAQMQRANLTGAYLEDADLTSADLQGATLAGAQLQRAKLAGAKLQGGNLLGAGLQYADLNGAWLQGADMQSAQLQGAEPKLRELAGRMPDRAFGRRGPNLGGLAGRKPNRGVVAGRVPKRGALAGRETVFGPTLAGVLDKACRLQSGRLKGRRLPYAPDRKRKGQTAARAGRCSQRGFQTRS
jgi:uncharacterized protein YjbI with pentapeptide repeats